MIAIYVLRTSVGGFRDVNYMSTVGANLIRGTESGESWFLEDVISALDNM